MREVDLVVDTDVLIDVLRLLSEKEPDKDLWHPGEKGGTYGQEDRIHRAGEHG